MIYSIPTFLLFLLTSTISAELYPKKIQQQHQKRLQNSKRLAQNLPGLPTTSIQSNGDNNSLGGGVGLGGLGSILASKISQIGSDLVGLPTEDPNLNPSDGTTPILTTNSIITTNIKTSLKTAQLTTSVTSTTTSTPTLTTSTTITSTTSSPTVAPSVVVVNVTSIVTASSSSLNLSSITLTSSSTSTSISPVTVLSTAQTSTSTSTSIITPTSTPTSAPSNNLASDTSHTMTKGSKITVVTFAIIGSSLVLALLLWTAARKFGFARKSGHWKDKNRAPSQFWDPDMVEQMGNSNGYNNNSSSSRNLSGRDSTGAWVGFDDDAMSVRSIRSGRSGEGMAGIGAVRGNYFDKPFGPEFTRPSSPEDTRVGGYPSVSRYGSTGGRSTKGIPYP